MKTKIDPHNLSILIVDDVKSMRSVIRSMLKNLNVAGSVYMAKNGVEALKVLHQARIDLAIVDWRMPVMNGTQLLEHIRNDIALRDIPVLMVTAESEKDIVLEAAEIEVEGYLIKPLKPAVLDEKIKSVIQNVNHPDKATLHIRKARQLEESGDLKTAILHLEQAVKLKPGASRLLRRLGLLYKDAGAETAFKKNLLKAVTTNPQDAVTRYHLAAFYWEKKEIPLAIRFFNEVVALTRKYNDEAVEFGKFLLQNSKAREAKALYSAIMSRSKKNTALMETIINICIEHGEHNFALTLLKKLMRQFPSNWDLVYQAGLVCEMMNALDDALEHFIAVDKNQFSRLDVKLKIATIYFHKSKVYQADQYLNMVLKKDPNNKQALVLRRLL